MNAPHQSQPDAIKLILAHYERRVRSIAKRFPDKGDVGTEVTELTQGTRRL
jgi:hypothetical protein